MSAPTISAADPQPGQPTPDPQPITGSPWGQRYSAYCCELAAGGDECDCAQTAAELAAAFRDPIHLERRLA